jgi:hypothetical protein
VTTASSLEQVPCLPLRGQSWLPCTTRKNQGGTFPGNIGNGNPVDELILG